MEVLTQPNGSDPQQLFQQTECDSFDHVTPML